jgi:phosphate-selective porin OprO/OprP
LWQFGFAAVLTLVCTRTAGAQAPVAAPPVTTGFDNGFFVQGANGDYRLVFGLTLQTDGRFPLDEPLPIVNTFALRKVRPTVSGRIARYFEFKVMPDFGNGTAVIQDAYVDTRFSSAFRLRVGKDKTPVGYELLIGDANLFFPERALASSLVPIRDVGIQVVGEAAGGELIYAGGIFNGVPDAASSTNDTDTNSAKDLAGRVLWQPWRTTPTSALSGLGFHLAGSRGSQAGPLPVFRTSVGQIYYTYALGAVANGERTRVTPAGFYFYKPFGVFAEYTSSTQDVSRGDVTQPIANHAMAITTALFLTGESASTGITRPRKPFNPEAGQWGALQVLARFSHLEVDGEAFVSDFAAVGASRRADQWTAGLNWYPTSFTKWYATYEHITFDKGVAGSRPAENVILFRGQLAF